MAEDKAKSILTYGLAPLAGLVLAILLTGLHSLLILHESVNESFRTSMASQKAFQLASFFDQRQSQLQRQLATAASSEAVVSPFRSRDAVGLKNIELLLLQTIPYAIKVKLIPRGTATIDRDKVLPFSYTSKDMVNRAEENNHVFAEAIPSDKDWVITMVAAVKDELSGQILGTLFVYLDRTAYIDDLELAVRGDGEAILIQHFGVLDHKPILILGNTTVHDMPTITQGLLSPHWEVHFTPSDRITTMAMGSVVDFLLPLVFFFLIALLGLVIGLMQLKQHVDADVGLLIERMADAFRGRHKPAEGYVLSVFKQVDDVIDGLTPAEPVGGTTQSVRPSKKRAAAATKKPVHKHADDVEITEIEDSDLDDEPVDEDLDFEDELNSEDIRAIFRAYDIRGIVDETLTSETIERIGQSIGSEALDRGEESIIVGADGRSSSPDVAALLIQGLTSTGLDVTNIGMVPTPLLYYATTKLKCASGVMVTASHNPAEYNGFKVVLAGETLEESGIQKLYTRFCDGDFADGQGGVTEVSITEDYVDSVCDDVVIAQPLKIVIDCGNGIPGEIAPGLFTDLGCEVVPLYCDVDGSFPNHAPDPGVPENLDDLISAVAAEEADLGIAFDGDGDRLVAISSQGEIIWPDRLLMLFAKDVVSRNPGADVIYDVKCTRHLNSVISSFGGRPIICRSGHSFVKAKLAETGAILGGEMSGHIYFKERWNGFDDGLYAAARLLEIVGAQSEPLEALLAEFPESLATPEIRVPVGEQEKFEVMANLAAKADFGDGNLTSVDGLRVDYSDGWGLIRVSNTAPCLTLRFEADDAEALERIKEVFKEQVSSVQSDLVLDF